MQAAPHLNKVLKHVQEQISDLPPGDFMLETNMKPYSSVKRKMESYNAKNPLELSDLIRGRIYYSDQFNLEDVIDILKTLFGNQIKKIDHNAHRAKEHGLEYHGITHVDLNINGINFEFQVLPVEYKPYKEFLHQIYEKFRNPKTLDKMSDKQKELLRKVHNTMYKKLEDISEDNRSSSN